MAKTPFHPWWQTTELHSQVYELGELADSVEVETALHWREPSNLDDMSHSRNCTLFEYARHYAYSIVKSRNVEKGTMRISNVVSVTLLHTKTIRLILRRL